MEAIILILSGRSLRCARAVLSVLFLFRAAAMSAQLLTNNGALIDLSADLQVNGDLLNASAGQFLNEATITITGDFTNNAGNSGFGTSEGSLVLAGGAQSIGGSSTTIFNDLTLAGPGDKSLQVDIEVGGAYAIPSGSLHVGDARLHLNGNDVTIRNAAPAGIQRVNGYIVSETDPLAGYGSVRWNIGEAAPAALYVIPFGNAATNSYLPFAATITAAGTGADGWIAMATYPTDPSATPNNRPLPTGLQSLIDVSGMENAPNVLDRWWVMESGGYATEPVATISFRYRDSEWNTGTNAILEGTLQLERQHDGFWQMMPTTTVVLANSLSTVGQPLTPSFWTAASIGSPLPVELLHFDAKPEGEEVWCSWSTATELNNDRFIVERSADGIAYIDLGEVDGAGNSQTRHDYVFADRQPLNGISYYRLRQADLDGTESWSDAVAVWRDAVTSELMVYPNPCNERLFITGGALEGGRLVILDATCRAVMDLVPPMQGGIDVSALPAGSYSVLITNATGRRSARFVKS